VEFSICFSTQLNIAGKPIVVEINSTATGLARILHRESRRDADGAEIMSRKAIVGDPIAFDGAQGAQLLRLLTA
jgi:hypothetical protein